MKILKESAQIDAAAEKDYLDGIQNGYIDIDAFHSAYDGIIKEAAAGLEGLFYKRGDKVLKSRGSYGNIKLMKGFNDPVYKAMVSLWIAQFKNKLPLKKDAMGAKQAAGSGEVLSMSRAELVKLAVATLNKAKGVNFGLTDVEELSGGSVMFTMIYPSGFKSY